jgi:predicted GTPase
MVLDINNNKRFVKMSYSDKNQAIRRKSDVPSVSAEIKRILKYGSTGAGKSSLIRLVTGIQTVETINYGSSYKFNFETE